MGRNIPTEIPKCLLFFFSPPPPLIINLHRRNVERIVQWTHVFPALRF